MAADVAGRDTDDGAYPKMAKDDAVSVSIVHQGAPFHRILVNLNGSIQDGKRNVCNAATGRTGKGWQAEMEIPLGKTPLNRAEVAKSPTWLGIARYYRVPSAAKGPDAACSTLSPVARVGNSIGNGNHETCMCFTWGPRVVYPKSPPPKP
jgi:hypothetical protein